MLVEVKKPITAAKIEKASVKIAKENRRGFDARKHAGKLKNIFGDGMEFQKQVRDDWD